MTIAAWPCDAASSRRSRRGGRKGSRGRSRSPCFLFVFHAISLTGKLIGAGSGWVYSGRCWQPPRLAQASLVR